MFGNPILAPIATSSTILPVTARLFQHLNHPNLLKEKPKESQAWVPKASEHSMENADNVATNDSGSAAEFMLAEDPNSDHVGAPVPANDS